MNRRLPSFADLPNRVREGLAGLPARWREWREGFRADPAILWRTPVLRVAALVALLLAAGLTLRWAIGLLAPGGRGQVFEQPTPWATLYVACTHPDCRAAYTTQQPMDFKAWPLKCERCGRPTVYRATRCPACRQWFASVPGAPATCPRCAEKTAAPQPAELPRRPSATGDDSEDPW